MLFVFEGLEVNWKKFVSFRPLAANDFERLKLQLQIFCSKDGNKNILGATCDDWESQVKGLFFFGSAPASQIWKDFSTQ